jgi:NAD(P)H-dependent FMN reductase
MTALEHLRVVLAEVRVATVRAQVLLSLMTDFENFTTFRPQPQHEKSVGTVLDRVVGWAGALQQLRSGSRT